MVPIGLFKRIGWAEVSQLSLVGSWHIKLPVVSFQLPSQVQLAGGQCQVKIEQLQNRSKSEFSNPETFQNDKKIDKTAFAESEKSNFSTASHSSSLKVLRKMHLKIKLRVQVNKTVK